MSHQNKELIKNRRKSTRFIRADIKAFIIKSNLLGIKESIACKLLDISSAGVLISTSTKLGTNVKLQLTLKFGADKAFKIKSKVTRQDESVHYLSDISFPTLQYFLNNKAAPLKSIHLFESNQELLIKFRDLKSSSVKVLTHVPINLNDQHSILFILNNEEQHKTNCNIDKYQETISYSYGIKFDKPSDALGDYILETQTDLIFK